MTQQTYAQRLSLESRDDQQSRLENLANTLKMEIRNSRETVEFLGEQVQCIDATGINRAEWSFTGCGLVEIYPGGKLKLIERV